MIKKVSLAQMLLIIPSERKENRCQNCLPDFASGYSSQNDTNIKEMFYFHVLHDSITIQLHTQQR